MSKFNKKNFTKLIYYIESMEFNHENIWVPIGILERMYDDDIGYIDKYFHTPIGERDRNSLIEKINFDK